VYREYIHTFTDDGCDKIILSHVEDNKCNKTVVNML